MHGPRRDLDPLFLGPLARGLREGIPAEYVPRFEQPPPIDGILEGAGCAPAVKRRLQRRRATRGEWRARSVP